MLDLYISNLPKIIEACFVHIKFVVVSVTIGTLVGVSLASVLSRFPRLTKWVMPLIGIFQTIPGIVFIGVLFVYTGMRPITVYIALTAYAIFPILKNSYAGILNVDSGIKEAARGIGMSKWQSLRRVELPIALPAIFTGIRMATVYTVSWAVLAAMIGQGGLGEFIYVGIDTNVQAYIIMGAVPAALLALLMGYLVDVLKNICVKRGGYFDI